MGEIYLIQCIVNKPQVLTEEQSSILLAIKIELSVTDWLISLLRTEVRRLDTQGDST